MYRNSIVDHKQHPSYFLNLPLSISLRRTVRILNSHMNANVIAIYKPKSVSSFSCGNPQKLTLNAMKAAITPISIHLLS